MKIYKNLWAGRETYFVRMRQDKRFAYGVGITNNEGKWGLRKNMTFYLEDLNHDSKHFPVVGEINLNEIIRRAIMEAVGVCDKGAWDEEP